MRRLLSLAMPLCAITLYDPASAQNSRAECATLPTLEEIERCTRTFSGLPIEHPPASNWEHTTETDRLDDARLQRIATWARETIRRRPRQQEQRDGPRAYLGVLCVRGAARLVVSIPGELVAGSSAVISYRVDSRPPVRGRGWRPSADYSTTGVWTTREALPIVRTMLEGTELFVRIDDSVFGRTEATFQLRGLREAMAPLLGPCRIRL